MRYHGRLLGYPGYGRVLWLLLLLLSFCSVASQSRFHHFYFSEQHGVPVYLTGLLPATDLHSFQQKVPGFQSMRAQLNDHERLLLVSPPDTDRQGILFQPAGIRLYPAGVSSGVWKATPCSLLSPLEIYFSDFSTNSATPYQLWQLPGPVNIRCSHFHYSGTSQVSYFRDLPLAASDALPFPDGTTIIEVPAVGKNTQGPAIPGAGGFGLQQLLGAGGGFGSWFDFRPGGGGGGYSNLLDISVMPALMAAAENNSDAETGDFEKMIVINIIDSANREWQQTYTKDEAQKLLADIDDGDELISRIQKLQIAVSAEITGDLSSVCRESVQRLGQVLPMSGEAYGQAIPGVIHLDGGKKDASTQTSPESGQQGSGNSGQAASHPRGTTKGGISGAAGGGDGNDEKEGTPKKLLLPCEASSRDQAKAVKKEPYFYCFRYLDKEYILEVQSTDERINRLICGICCYLCHQASTYCGQHFHCNQCLQDELKHTSRQNPWCPRCKQSLEKGIVAIPFTDKFFVNRLAVSCPGREEGCTETPCIENLESHCSTCLYIEVKCPNDGCDTRVLRGKLPVHKDECGYQVIPCPNESDGCSVKAIRKHMPEHQAVCGYEMINCPIQECPQMTYRHLMDAHRGECDYVIVACDNVFAGKQCQTGCRRGALVQHKQTECLYQIIQCPDCQKDFTRLALSQHSQMCEYRPVQCTFCNQFMPWYQLLHHRMTHLRDDDSQNQENTLSQFSDFCAEAAARQEKLFEQIKRLEEQLKSDAGNIEQLSQQCEKSQVSIESSKAELCVINQKKKKLENTLSRFQLTIDFADFQLRGFSGDATLRAFKDEEEINQDCVYCIIPERELNLSIEIYNYPYIVIDFHVSDVYLRLTASNYPCNYALQTFAYVKLHPDSHLASGRPVSRVVSVGLLDKQGRAATTKLKLCPENYYHNTYECGCRKVAILLIASYNKQDRIHNGYLVLLLKLED